MAVSRFCNFGCGFNPLCHRHGDDETFLSGLLRGGAGSLASRLLFQIRDIAPAIQRALLRKKYFFQIPEDYMREIEYVTGFAEGGFPQRSKRTPPGACWIGLAPDFDSLEFPARSAESWIVLVNASFLFVEFVA